MGALRNLHTLADVDALVLEREASLKRTSEIAFPPGPLRLGKKGGGCSNISRPAKDLTSKLQSVARRSL
jgi:hypothetical protein